MTRDRWRRALLNRGMTRWKHSFFIAGALWGFVHLVRYFDAYIPETSVAMSILGFGIAAVIDFLQFEANGDRIYRQEED